LALSLVFIGLVLNNRFFNQIIKTSTLKASFLSFSFAALYLYAQSFKQQFFSKWLLDNFPCLREEQIIKDEIINRTKR